MESGRLKDKQVLKVKGGRLARHSQPLMFFGSDLLN